MVMSQKLPKGFKKFPHPFPTRENCNPKDPYQAYLWALIALPYQKGAPWVMPVDYMQLVSKRLWDCFGPPNPDWKPTIKYQRPLNTDPHWLFSAGDWVDADAPERDQRRPAERAADSLAVVQQAELGKELLARMSPNMLKAALTEEQRQALREERE